MFAHRSFVGRRKGRHAGRAALRWTEDANPKAVNFLENVAWAPNLALWCAVGHAIGGDAYIITSPQAGAWTERANPKNVDLRDVAWSGGVGQLVAVGINDGADQYALTSPGGINWTERATVAALGVNLYAVAAQGGGQCLACGQATGSGALILISGDDGNAWARAGNPNPRNVDLYAVIWSSAHGRYILAGGADGVDGYILTSPDGVDFTERPNPSNRDIYSLAVGGGGRIVAVGAPTGDGAYVITSDDGGLTWQGPWPNPRDAFLIGLVWTGQQFVGVGHLNFTRAYVVASRDGRSWVELPHPKEGNGTLQSIARNPSGEIVCTGGDDGQDTYILRTRELQ